jgi:hypothetical protein
VLSRTRALRLTPFLGLPLLLVGATMPSLGVVACGPCSGAQSGGCAVAAFGALELNCPADVVSAELTGPCAPPSDASAVFVADVAYATGPSFAPGTGFSCAPATAMPFAQCKYVFFEATGPGVCHISLTFANGFQFLRSCRSRSSR